jgi:sulfite oxidase
MECAGIVGARSVKWLDKIVVSGRESNAHWQQKDYKGFQPAVDWADVKWDSAPAIQTLPVTSAICEPTPDMPAHDEDDITVKGYAISGGGHAVVRVDVSADGGKSWITADLKPSPTGRVHAPADGSLIPLEQWPTKTAMTGAQLAERAWAWTQWEAQVPLTKEMRAKACASKIGGKSCQLELISRAVDSAYNNQPDTVAPIWNLRGVVNNAWHRTHIEVSPPE